MKNPRSMSIIIVDLQDGWEPSAYVTYEEQGEGGTRTSVQLKLDLLDDATDIQMWAQMAAARVCDAL